MQTIDALDDALAMGLVDEKQHAAALRPPRDKFVNFGNVTPTALLSSRPILTVANHNGDPVVTLHASAAGFSLVASLRPAEAIALVEALKRAASYVLSITNEAPQCSAE